MGGLGHVGLPLATIFASKGMKVAIVDVNKKAINEFKKSGKIPFVENQLQELVDKFKSNMDVYEEFSQQKVIRSDWTILTAPHDVLFKIIRQNNFSRTKLIIRGTVRFGTTALCEKYSRTEVAYCPERMAEGDSLKELLSLTQIIGCRNEEQARELSDLFGLFAPKIVVVTPEEAELAKLFCNSYRYIHFGIANELYKVANLHDVDFYNVIHAAKANYPRMSTFPNPGWTAGFCLGKDTKMLPLILGDAAEEVNFYLPNFVVSRLGDIFNKKVGILGMAAKANIDDIRQSLSFNLKDICEEKGAIVSCYDPYIKEFNNEECKENVLNSDIIILGAPHDCFKELNLGNARIVDLWDFYKNPKWRKI